MPVKRLLLSFSGPPSAQTGWFSRCSRSRPRAGGVRQRAMARHGGHMRLSHRLSLLRALYRPCTCLCWTPARPTPAHRHNDGLDYVPTDKVGSVRASFCRHRGRGATGGPVLAAQMGYLPGALWLMIGVVFAGAVQDFLVLFISTRRDGRSLGDLVKTEMGQWRASSPWSAIWRSWSFCSPCWGSSSSRRWPTVHGESFTVFATLPIAVFMGVYGRYLRPGRIL